MGKYKILVIDDDPNILKLSSTILTHEGYDVVQAGSGAEALDKFRIQAPDMIIVDLMLPDMNGVEIIQTLKDKHNCSIPVIFLTGIITKEEEASHHLNITIKEKNHTVLAKPLDRAKLLAMTRNYLQG